MPLFAISYSLYDTIFNRRQYVIEDDETTTDNDEEGATDNNEPNDEQPLLPQQNPSKFRKSFHKNNLDYTALR